ncbi:hypothetical protein AJ79_06056 [Helicocarpus griseus UAMH5409]|uniref:Survival Motor Neuron Gemin2-binding domain-containing protein n=1 Tax=Helicocarpus griseus UAMH5409 TaxID=1447875 RepID=A0A2B7XH79_9EURO|nr:hypothetical protein AJ79_06056 [Helicocarpus griseus UAMH5409]
MGKRRRSKKNKPLTQEEIWDDSALIQSWDDAVEEYNLYHSIQARGENVEDVLREEEARARAENGTGGGDVYEPEEQVDSYAEPDHGADDEDMETPQEERPSAQAKPEANNATTGGDFANMPHLVTQAGGDASSSDDGLKNLMMAWYYAGYYTGLYEGQQRANQTS